MHADLSTWSVLPLTIATAFAMLVAPEATAQPGPPATNPTPSQSGSSGPSTPGDAPRRMMGPPEAFAEAKEIPAPTNDEELAAAIKKLADNLAARDRFSGSILLAADGKILIDGAWGEANRDQKVASTPETAYDIGSIGKLFTQIAILQLAEAGKLKRDDTIGKHLPGYPNREAAAKITLEQLLRHRSGMPDIFTQVTPQMGLPSKRELKEFLPLFADKPLEFAPGSEQRYSSSGYIVLGLVIEAVSSEDYFRYVTRHILEPAQMKHSGFFDRKHLPPTVAHSYANGRDVTAMHAVRGTSAGGLQASAGDLLRLVQAVHGGKLLRPESVNVLNSLVPRPPGAPAPQNENKLIGYAIQGGAPGVNAQLAIDATGRYTRVILCNAEPPMASSMGTTIRDWVAQLRK
jgi:CubicO group peptidase (beta-lactamase class C family)